MKPFLCLLVVLFSSIALAEPRDAALRLRHGAYAASAVAVSLESPPDGGIGWAITAHHVLKGGSAPIVLHTFDYDGDKPIQYHEFPAKLYSAIPEHDLALLVVYANDTGGKWSPAVLAAEDYRFSIHDQLTAYGCGGGRDPEMQKYLPVTHYKDRGFTAAVIVDDGIEKGRSGGPIFNSAGRVVGVASASTDRFDTFHAIVNVEGRGPGPIGLRNSGYYTPIDAIWELFK